MELADVVAVLGGAGGVCNVSGSFVSRKDEDDEDDEDDVTMGCFDGCSWVDMDSVLRQS